MAKAKQPEAERFPRLEELRRRKQSRRMRKLALVVLMLAVGIFYLTGTYSSALSLLGDFTDSVQIFLDRSGSFPVQTGIAEPLRVEELAGGFVELGSEDAVIFSGTGSLLRSIQPNYARPAISVGRTRFCIYNRAGNELRVESRTRTLYTQKFEDNILFCTMSGNGCVAVVTQSNRYTAQTRIYQPTFGEPYVWLTTDKEGVPIRAAFATDNRRLAMGCLAARNGELTAGVYLLDTQKNEVGFEYAGRMGTILELIWLSSDRLLCVFEDGAVVLDTATGEELENCAFGGSTVKSISSYGNNTALLLETRAGSQLVVLDETLNELVRLSAVGAKQAVITHTAVYLLRESSVECLSLGGESQWNASFDGEPRAVLNADRLLVFVNGSARVLEQPQPSGEAAG